MKISELIEQLQEMKYQHGDILVAAGRSKANGNYGEGPVYRLEHWEPHRGANFPEHVLITAKLYEPNYGKRAKG